MGETDRKRRLTLGPRCLGALSGAMLMVPHLLPAFAPLQLAALVPILWVLASEKTSWRTGVGAGFYMGIFYTLPQVFILLMPPWIVAVLLADLTILMMLFAGGATVLLRCRPVLGIVAAAGLLAGLDCLNFTLVPIWGIAQSLVRPWSSYPRLIAFVSMTGLTGVMFVLVCLQAAAVRAARDPASRGRALAVAGALLALVAAADVVAWNGEPTGTITVAAVGWASPRRGAPAPASEVYSPEGFEALYADPVAEAARQGAKLVVSPEAAFTFVTAKTGDQAVAARDEWLDRFRTVARANKVFLAFGYRDLRDDANRLVFMGPDGTVRQTYTKTHLTPFETTIPGSGEVAVTDVLGHRVGGMICHDDNYTSLTRAHGRREVALVAVPTLDWPQVKSAHFQSSITRAIESRYAIVRAAWNGISAIISPRGEVLARRDHFTEGPGMIVAEVELAPGRTLFSNAGHWPAMAGGALAAACFAVMLLGAPRPTRTDEA